MRFLLLALLTAGPAAAALVEAPRAVPMPLAATPSAFAAPGLLPLSLAASVPMPAPAAPAPVPAPAAAASARFLKIGSFIADARAPGAAELAKALFDGGISRKEALPLIGLFTIGDARVINGFAMGSFGVNGHQDAVPPQADRRTLGGYTLMFRPDGTTSMLPSGSQFAELTPAVKRSVFRHFGLRPARETRLQRLRRLAWRAWDAAFAAAAPKR